MKVLVTDHVFADLDAEKAALAEIGCELELAPDPAALPEAVGGAAALMVCFAQVDEQVIEAASDCKIIARYGIGVDNVDVDAATRRGIQVTNVPDYCLDEVADHAMALLLAAARGVVGAARGVREGDWTVPQENIHRIAGRRLALIGAGRIGRKVADRARAFGYEVVVYDPYADDSVASVEEAVAEADAISVHAPLTDETRHIIGSESLAAMRRRPILVNTSRGGLVDLEAVTRALDEDRLAAVALDVTEPEPLPDDHPLRTHPRAIVTPHMSFYSEEAQAELQRRAVEEVIRALSGEPPRCPVNQLQAA
ncbi:MAG TPA: C-terminal binding protein [Solirubrobacteraceae bacterium]|nr:C-terminal binding protein [Solirubrobacteraceae bacterium]